MSVEPTSHRAAQSEETPPPHAQLIQLMMGMWHTQILAAAARFDVADRIAAGMTKSDELARAAGADREAFYRLLRACAALGVVIETAPRQFMLTPVGECLRTDSPTSLKDLIIAEAAPGHWLPWGRLYDAIKSGREMATETLGMGGWAYYAANPEEAMHFARGMGNLSAIAAQTIAPFYDPSPFRQIVDVGGSQGVLLRSLLQRAPRARGVLFDLPDIIESARPVIAASEMKDRVQLVAGDFFKEVPPGGDLYVMKQILHDWDDDRGVSILANVHRAMSAAGKVLIVESLLPDRPEPSPVSFIDMNMLVMLGGRERTAAEFATLLARGGFSVQRVIPMPGLLSLIEATRA